MRHWFSLEGTLTLRAGGDSRIDCLTSLRFFAAAMIVWLHVGGAMGIPKINNFALGGGVSIFFVLSGFILTYRYPELRDRREIGLFLASRIGRIWPAYAVGVLLEIYMTWYAFFHDAEWVAHIVINFAMIQTWIPWLWFSYSFNAPSWSVSTELFFYLAFPLLIINFERTWWWKLALAAAFAMLMVAIAIAINADYGSGAVPGVLLTYEHPLARLLEFVCGMCAALAYRKAAHLRLPVSAATIAEALAVVLVFATLYRSGTENVGSQLGRWYYSGADLALPAAILIFVMAFQQGAISKALTFRPLVFLGEISYSIFLIHYPIGRLMPGFIKQYPDISLGMWGIIYVGAVLLASSAIYLLVERPLRRAIVSGAAWLLEARALKTA